MALILHNGASRMNGQIPQISICCLALLSAVGISVASEINVTVTGEHEVRYTSGKAIYVEALVGDRWIGKFWNIEGRSERIPLGTSIEDAFEVRIQDVPQTEDRGRVVSQGWRWVGASEHPETRRGASLFVVELANSTVPIRVKIHTWLDGTPVLTRWLEITNTGNLSVALTELCPWSGPLWSKHAAVSLGHSLRREVPWEGWFGWSRLTSGPNVTAVVPPGPRIIRNDTDRLWDDPYFILRNESDGEYFFGELGWPADYEMEFDTDDGLSFKIGPVATQALRVIAPDETITTPAVHLGYVKGDFDAAVQAMHEHIRRSVFPSLPSQRAYRIQYLMPEDWPISAYRGEAYNETNMKKCMDVAAALGMEVFILDGPNWGSAYGNWLVPDHKRFPNGLAPLVEYAHQKGLLFGLYVEPEGGRDGGTPTLDPRDAIGGWKQSKVYQEHPDWFDSKNLNLAIPAAAAYFESTVSELVGFHKLDLYRHDQNGIVFYPPGPGSGQTIRDRRFIESNYWRHYEALYSSFHRIHQKYPDLILQQAAAGNFRRDLDTAGAFHEQFTSDRATMPYVYRMLSGLSVFLPPETLVNSNGMARPQDLPDLDTTLRGAFAAGNTPMVFNALLPSRTDDLTAEFRQKFLHYADLYKTFMRPLLPTCKVYHLGPVNESGAVESGNWFAMEFTDPGGEKGWATIIRLAKSEPGPYVFKPKGLNAHRNYRVTFDNAGTTEVINGSHLMETGLTIQPGAERASELMLFTIESLSK